MLVIKLLKKKNPDSVVVKLWDNKKTHALICLGIWIIFFLFVYIIVVLPYYDNNDNSMNRVDNSIDNVTTENVITFEGMKNKLLNGEYDYKYTINTSLGKTIYTGSKTQEKDLGYKENSEGLVKYEINNDGIFKINMDEKIPIEDLYIGLNESFFDIQKIYELTTNLTENIDEEKNEISYENENMKIVFKINEQSILSINIKDNDDDYLLEFSNIK